MACETLWNGNLLYFNFKDEVTSDELMQASHTFYSDERSEKVAVGILDFTGVSDISVSEVDVKVIAALDRASAATKREITVCFISDRDDITELVDEYIEYSEESNWQFLLFSSLSECIAELEKSGGIDVDYSVLK